MATAAQLANWLENNQDKKGEPLYEKAMKGYGIARRQELSSEQPVPVVEEVAQAVDSPQPQTLADKLYQEEPTGDLYSQPEFEIQRRNARRGFTDPMDAIARGVADPRMPEQRQEFVESQQQKEAEYQAARAEAGQSGFDPGRLLGNIGSMAVPGALAAKGVKAATWAGKSLTGAGTGGVYGALTPTYVDEEAYAPTVKRQIGTGAALGGGVTALAQPAGKVAKAVYNYGRRIKDPWTKAGQQKGAVEFIEKQLGDETRQGMANKAKVVSAAVGAKPNETVGQAIVRNQKTGHEFGSSIVQLEDELARARTGVPLRNQRGLQGMEREKLVDAIQGGKSVRSLEKARSVPAVKKYKKAFKEKIPITEKVTVLVPPKPTNILDNSGNPVMGEAKEKIVTRVTAELKGILDDPFVKKAIPAANNLAKSKKISIRSNPVQYLHYIKGGLDKQLRLKSISGQDALSNQEKETVRAVKGKLVAYLKKHSKKYEKARSHFAKKSGPVDEAKLREELKKALKTPSEQERSAAFLRAWKEPEKTLKRAKIGVKKEFKHILDPVDEKGVKRVYTELLDKEKYKTLTKLEGVLTDLPSEITVTAPKILWRPAVIANHALANLVKHTKPKVQKHIIDMLTNPDLFVKSVTSLDSTKKEMATRLLQEVLILSTREEAVQDRATEVTKKTTQNVIDAISKGVQ